MALQMTCPPDCPGRSPTCHSECETYLTARDERQRKNKEKRKLDSVNEMESQRTWRIDRIRKTRKKYFSSK